MLTCSQQLHFPDQSLDMYQAYLCIAALSVVSSSALLHNMSTPTLETGRALSLTHDEERACQKYANRTYVPKSQQKHPTLLWTFPGSGSGWVRLLIEHATGETSDWKPDMHCNVNVQ